MNLQDFSQWYEFTIRNLENCVDPDQDLHCFQIKTNLDLHVEGFWEIFIPQEFLEPVIPGR